jgi:hypothetical protein
MRRYSIFFFVAAFAAPALAIMPIGPIPAAGTRTTGYQANPDISQGVIAGDRAVSQRLVARESH